MGLLLVVVVDSISDAPSDLAASLEGVEVDALELEGPPEPRNHGGAHLRLNWLLPSF